MVTLTFSPSFNLVNGNSFSRVNYSLKSRVNELHVDQQN